MVTSSRPRSGSRPNYSPSGPWSPPYTTKYSTRKSGQRPSPRRSPLPRERPGGATSSAPGQPPRAPLRQRALGAWRQPHRGARNNARIGPPGPTLFPLPRRPRFLAGVGPKVRVWGYERLTNLAIKRGLSPRRYESPSYASGRFMSGHPGKEAERSRPTANICRSDRARPPRPRLCGEPDIHNHAERSDRPTSWNAVQRKSTSAEGREDEMRRGFWFIRAPIQNRGRFPYVCSREWHRKGEILRRPHARGICA
jgi:hypothetical protein